MENVIQTENFNSLLVLPPTITIITIAVLFGIRRWRDLFLGNKLIAWFTFSLLAQNIIHVITYGNIYTDYNFLLRTYYCVAVVTAALFISLSEHLYVFEPLPRKFFYAIVTISGAFLIISISSSDWIIAGAAKFSYSISRIPGRFYWLFQIYILLCVICGPILIWRSIVTSPNPLDKKRRVVVFYSLIPIIVTVLLVILFMQFGVEITWSLFLPFCTLIFVLVYLATDNRQDLFRLLVQIPFSRERKAYNQLNRRVIEYISKSQTDEKLSLKEMLSEIEKTFIANALEIKDGNHNLAAELLSISLSTVYRHKEKKEDNISPSETR